MKASLRWRLADGREMDLITPEQLNDLPSGTRLLCIDGQYVYTGWDYIDKDTRYGYLAYGLEVLN